MPWLETSPMDQRKQFIADFHRGLQSVTELQRQTVAAQFERHGMTGDDSVDVMLRRIEKVYGGLSASDQRAAMVIAERTLCEGHAPADPLAQVSVKYTGTSIGGREWIEVSVTLNGRHASLAGLAPAGGAK